MPSITLRHLLRRLTAITLAMLFCGQAGWTQETSTLRVEAGLDLFPSFIAADLDITDKTSDDGTLLLLLVYENDRAQSVRLKRALTKVKTIRKLPLRIKITSDLLLSKYQGPNPAAIFIAQHLERKRLDPVLKFGQRAGALVFSPHEGHVKEGVIGGIHVSNRILPYVNMQVLRASGIRLKPFFLRIAKQYEQ
ncbi:MAG: hypothetical protein AB2777_21640 [Candidatus Thiodiazotropha endolucinida]